MASGVDRKRLETWKEIAAYLGVTSRAAQIWERERGLPVHRLPGPRSCVYTTPDELDEWRQTLDGAEFKQPASFKKKRRTWWTLGALAVLAAAISAIAGRGGESEPNYVKIDGPMVRAFTQKGIEIWSFVLPGGSSIVDDSASDLDGPRSWVGDLDGDGVAEVLLAHWRANPSREGTELLCLSADGTLRWSYRPGRVVRSKTEEFGGPYFIRGFRVARLVEKAPWSILVTSHHHQYFPNVVSRLESSGKVMAEYWHSGNLWRIEAADFGKDGRREVILAGVDNERGEATVVVLDPDRMTGASRERRPEFQLTGLGMAQERSRIWLPRSCINRRFLPFPTVTRLVTTADGIRVDTTEWLDSGRAASLSFQLDRAARLARVVPSSYFLAIHAQLKGEGKLDHNWSPEEQRSLELSSALAAGP